MLVAAAGATPAFDMIRALPSPALSGALVFRAAGATVGAFPLSFPNAPTLATPLLCPGFSCSSAPPKAPLQFCFAALFTPHLGLPTLLRTFAQALMTHEGLAVRVIRGEEGAGCARPHKHEASSTTRSRPTATINHSCSTAAASPPRDYSTREQRLADLSFSPSYAWPTPTAEATLSGKDDSMRDGHEDTKLPGIPSRTYVSAPGHPHCPTGNCPACSETSQSKQTGADMMPVFPVRSNRA